MELVKKDCYICFECKELADRVNFTQHKDRQLELCEKCLLKAYLLTNPIQFDKEFIELFFEQFTQHDKVKYSNISKLYDFIKPFLESK